MRICIVARVCLSTGSAACRTIRPTWRAGSSRRARRRGDHRRHPEGLREEEIDGVRWHYVEAPTDNSRAGMAEALLRGVHRRINARSRSTSFTARARARSSSSGSGVQRETPFVVMFHGNFVGLVKASLATSGPSEEDRAT